MVWLPCRHHIFELILEAVYNEAMGPSTGPEVKLFKDFQKTWHLIDQSKFSTILELDEVDSFLDRKTREEIMCFAESQIIVSFTTCKTRTI